MDSDSVFQEEASPTLGLSLSLEGANKILRKHLNLECVSLSTVKRGFNNLTTIATAENKSDFIIRLSGRFWTTIKTEGEVAAIILLHEKCPDIPLPKIYGFCSNKELSVIGNEYILMERLKGTPLDEIWEQFESPIQQHVADQVANYVAQMKSLKFEKIGSFCFKASAQYTDIANMTSNDIQIGEIIGQHTGPFEDYISYIVSICQEEIKVLKSCKFMKPMLEFLPRIEKLLTSLQDGTALSTQEWNVPFAFHHGDFEFQNILVDSKGNITGLLDFEFAGSFPLDNDWFDGFSDLHANTAQTDLQPSYQPSQENSMKSYFLDQCKHYSDQQETLFLPLQIPGHLTRAKLHYFMSNICPWFLRAEIDPPPPSWISEREKAMEFIDYVLKDFKF